MAEKKKEVCEDCGREKDKCPGTRRYLAETAYGVEEVEEQCDGLIERA